MSKPSPKTNSVYEHIWRSIAALMGVVFLIAGASITIYVRRTTRAEIETQEKAYLADVDTMISHQISSAQQILNMLLTNPFVVQSIYTGNQSWNTESYWSGQIIVNAINSNQLYNSIYVIAGDQVAIKSSRRYQSQATEEQLIASMQHKFQETFIPWRSEVGNRIDYNLMILSPLETVSIPNQVGGALINMDLSRMADLVFSNRGERSIFLIWENQVIAGSRPDAFFRAAEEEPVLLSAMEKGSGLYEGQYVCVQTNAAYGYTLCSMQNYGALMAPVTHGLFLLMGILALLLALGLGVSRRVAHHAYVPVKTILIELEEHLPAAQEEAEGLSEVQRVSRTIRKTSEIVSAYRRDAEAVRLSRCIHSGVQDHGNQELMEKALGWQPGGRITMILIWAEQAENARMASDVLQGSLAGCSRFLTLDVPGQRLLSLIYMTEAERDGENLLRESVGQVLRLMAAQGNGKIVMALQGMEAELSDLHGMYLQLDERMRNRVFCGENTCLMEPAGTEIAPEVIQKVCRAALNPVEEEFLLAARECLDACRLIPAREAYHQLATVCMRISEISPQRSRDTSDRLDTYRKHLNALYALTDQKQLMGYLQNVYQAAQTQLNQQKASGSNPLAEQVMSYIQAHFDDPCLSAGQVAETMGISVSYLSRVVSKSQGCGFPELLQRVRLEYAASQMLARPELSIAELAQQAGFSSSSYFTASFKKMYGVTPSGYRLKMRGGGEQGQQIQERKESQ